MSYTKTRSYVITTLMVIFIIRVNVLIVCFSRRHTGMIFSSQLLVFPDFLFFIICIYLLYSMYIKDGGKTKFSTDLFMFFSIFCGTIYSMLVIFLFPTPSINFCDLFYFITNILISSLGWLGIISFYFQ